MNPINIGSAKPAFRCISCGRVITEKSLSEVPPCPCCEHLTRFSNDYTERSTSHAENSRIMADLRQGLAARLADPQGTPTKPGQTLAGRKPELALAALTIPYLPQFGRKIYDTWQYGGGMGLGYNGYGNVLGKGLPVCEVPEAATDKSFTELWLSDQGSPALVQGSLLGTFEEDHQHGSVVGQQWHVNVMRISFEHEIVRRHSKELADKCWENLCAYADKKVRIETFPEQEIRAIFKDFYFHGDLGPLCDFAFNYVLYDMLVKQNQDAELLALARTRLEAGGLDQYSILIVEHLDGNESALMFIARDFKAGRLGSREMSRAWRNRMHILGAKEVLGWCPCDRCSSTHTFDQGFPTKRN